jgi:glutaredoxin
MKKPIIEFQYFEDCPNHKRMRDHLQQALQGIEDNVELKEIPVEDEQTAMRVQFRGSPTLLINGNDIEGMPAPEHPFFACRFYPNGIPSAEAIGKKIREHLSSKN